MKILAIESSCDETSAAVIEDGQVKSNVISSQLFHAKYGGVVPELASRAHIKSVSHIVREALSNAAYEMSQIEAVAVTAEPGLIGSLIVGSNFAKGLSIKYNIPVAPVNHIEGHIFSGLIQDDTLSFPIICLVVSGGHTAIFHVESYNKYTVLGATIDDAAGEAFDKIATLMDLPYPGGPWIDKMAKIGNPKAYDFPRSMYHTKNYDFSFSGLKTSVRYFLAKEFPNGIPEDKKADIAASVQAAIVDVLTHKTINAALDSRAKGVVIAGGVSANSGLRDSMKVAAEKKGIKFVAPNMAYCMDNAAMIGFIAEKKLSELGGELPRELKFVVKSNALRAPRPVKDRRSNKAE
jgi:N6-L-threonylcarbamoyladenine synthase